MEQIAHIALVAAFAAFLAGGALVYQRRSHPRSGALNGRPVVFVFDRGHLFETSPGARALIPEEPGFETIEGLRKRLAPVLGNVDLYGSAGTDAHQATDEFRVTARRRRGTLRLEIRHRHGGDTLSLLLSRILSEREAEIDAVPLPLWRQTPDGELRWANAAYRDMAEQTDTSGEPIDGQLAELATCEADGLRDTCNRLEHRIGHETLVAGHAGDLVAAAVASRPASVSDDDDEGGILQTLSVIFASLPVGLAIFDKSERLLMFNPALSDFTKVPADRLAARPTILDFFDLLRDAAMVPEPRDFARWRDGFLALARSAADGAFCDIWHLTCGQTVRVGAGSQPDGALVLSFENISDEVAVTRNYRAQLDTAQAAFDGLGTAIAVFHADGSLVLSNEWFDRMWGIETSIGLLPPDLSELGALWEQMLISHKTTEAFLETVRSGQEEQGFHDDVWTKGGRKLRCHVGFVRGGKRLVTFSPALRRASESDGHLGTGQVRAM